MESAAHDELKNVEGEPQQGHTPLGAMPPQGCATRCGQGLLVEQDQRVVSRRNGQLQLVSRRRNHVATVRTRWSYHREQRRIVGGDIDGRVSKRILVEHTNACNLEEYTLSTSRCDMNVPCELH